MPFYVVKTPNNFWEATAYNPSRHFARASDGTLWCCYAGPVAGIRQIFVSYSTDNGVTWTEEQITFAAVRHQEYPSIAIDSADNVHIVWTGSGWGINVWNYNLQHFKRTAGVWGAQEALSDRAWDQEFASLIWAFHPTVAGAKPNVLDDYLFVFTGQNDPAAVRVEFFTPTAPPMFRINRAFALSREEL